MVTGVEQPAEDVGRRFDVGLFFDDFRPGLAFASAGRTVSQAMLDMFSGVTGDFSDVHTDAEVMRRTPFGAPIAHAILSLGVLQGLMWQSGYVRNTAMATLGWEELRWPRPVYAGDTVTARWVIETVRRSRSHPEAGILTERCTLTNQAGEQVLGGVHVLLVRRASGPPDQSGE